MGAVMLFALASRGKGPAQAVFHPPPEQSIPAGPYGDMVRLGRDIFRDTGRFAKPFVGNDLRCGNCHLDDGRRAGSSPLWAAWVAYPAYRAKNRHVNTFAERVQECFRYSMNGTPPPPGDPVLVALESYAAWLARDAIVGLEMPGRGFPALAAPPVAPDAGRGATVYQRSCAQCHGADGAGQSVAGQVMFPPLWGSRSFTWGAGMQAVDTAAAFIKTNMPLGQGGTLSDQDAWDVALFLDSHERPQDPRFTGSVAETRRLFHDSPWSMYGRTVGEYTLGSGPVQSGGAASSQK